jgi:hypothetical protein
MEALHPTDQALDLYRQGKLDYGSVEAVDFRAEFDSVAVREFIRP